MPARRAADRWQPGPTIMAVSILVIVARRAAATDWAAPEAPVAATVLAIYATSAVLLPGRTAACSGGGARQVASLVPSLIFGAGLFLFAPEPTEWSAWLIALFTAGGMLAAVSLATLGRSFGMAAARRTLVERGPYRVVRHPAYVGELVASLACVMAVPPGSARRLAALLLFAALVASVAWRITQEEALLGGDPRWSAFARRTRYRLVPGIW